MGKQIKSWTPPEEDEIIDQEKPAAKTAWMPPADDIVVEEPVKKKEQTGSVSPPPAPKPGEPSGASTVQISPEQQKEIAKIKVDQTSPGPLASLESASKLNLNTKVLDTPLMASINTIKSGIADQIPKEYYVQRLRMSKGSFGDLFDPRSNLNAFGSKLPAGISRDEFARWSNNNRDKVLGKSYDDRAKTFLTEKLGAEGFENMKAAFKEKNIEERVGFEREIQQQNVEAGKRTAGVVQNLKDVEDAGSLLNFAGGMIGQALYRVPLSKASQGWGSVMAESAAVYDRQLDLIAEREGKSREEIIRLGLDKPADGQALAVLAGTMDAASSMNLLGWFRKAAVKEVSKGAVKQFAKEFAKGGIPEAITEAAQGEIEEFAAAEGADVEYNPDAWRIATGAIGGVLGGGIISGAVSVDLTPEQQAKPMAEVVQEQIKNPNLEEAAQVIQAKVEQSGDSGVYTFNQPTSDQETQAAPTPSAQQEGEVSEAQKEETFPVQEEDQVRIESIAKRAMSGEVIKGDDLDFYYKNRKAIDDLMNIQVYEREKSIRIKKSPPLKSEVLDKNYGDELNETEKEFLSRFKPAISDSDVIPSRIIFKTPITDIDNQALTKAMERGFTKEVIDVNKLAPTDPLQKKHQIRQKPDLKNLPEVFLKKDGTYAIFNGHHRIAEQILSGSKEVKVKVYKDDRTNQQGIRGEVREGQESVQTEPVEGASPGAAETGGVLQKQEEITGPESGSYKYGTDIPVESSSIEPTDSPDQPEKAEISPQQPSGTRTLKIADRILNSDANEAIKRGVREKGAEYIPKRLDLTDKEATDLLDLYGNEKAETIIRDTKNDITQDTRTALAARLYQRYKTEADTAADETVKQTLYNKAVDIALFGANQAKEAGRAVNANKIWRAITADEDLMVLAMEKENQNVAKEIISPIQKEVTQTKEQFDEQVRKMVEQKVAETIEARAKRAKLFTKEQKKKINDFFESKKIDTKGTANDISRVVGAAIWNGSMDAVKRAVLTGADIANAVQAGIDYIRDNYKGTDFNEGEFRDSVSREIEPVIPSQSEEQSKIQKAIEATNKSITDLEKKIAEQDLSVKERKKQPTSPELEDLRKKRDDLRKQLNKMRREALKVSDIDDTAIKTPRLKGRKKKQFIQELVDEYNEKGTISDDRFEQIYAKQLGYEEYTEEDRARIRELARVISEVEKFVDVVKASSGEQLRQNIAKYKDLLARAQKANQALQEYARKPSNVWDTLITIMQGNLLTPLSIVTNVYSNAALQPLRFVSTGVGSIVDQSISGLAKMGLLNKSYKDTSIDLAALQKGLIPGGWNGIMEGLKQLKEGQLASDKDLREIQSGFNPISAVKRWGDADRELGQKINDAIEGTFGFPAEGMFRLLNFGDKPFRRAAEMSRAMEIGAKRGLKGDDLMKFIMFPDEGAAKEIDEAGKTATFQNDSRAGKIAQALITILFEGGKIPRVGNVPGISSLPYIGGPLKLLIKSQIPYVKTPVNIIVETFDYALPEITFLRGVYGIRKGDRRDGSVLIGKAVVGWIIRFVAAQLFRLGLLSWDDDKDKKGRNIQYDTVPPGSLNMSALSRGLSGQGWSIKDDDSWVAYKKMGVTGILFDNYSSQRFRAAKEGTTTGYVEEMLTSAPRMLSSSLEQTFLKGTNSFLNALQGGYETQQWAIETIGAISSIVLPNTVATVSKSSDEYIRDTYSRDFGERLLNTFKAKVFLGGQVPPKVNLWGEKVTGNPEGRNKYVYYLFDPTKFKNVDTDSYKWKLYEAWKGDNFNSEWLPAMPTRNLKVRGVDMKLSPKEFEQFATFIGQERARAVQAYIKSGWQYQKPERRIERLKEIYDEGRERGKQKFLMQTGWNVLTPKKLESINENR